MFSLGGDGNGFFVVIGLFVGNLLIGFLVMLKIKGGFVGLGLIVLGRYVGRVKFDGLLVGLGL